MRATPGPIISGMYSLPLMPLRWTKASPDSAVRSTKIARPPTLPADALAAARAAAASRRTEVSPGISVRRAGEDVQIAVDEAYGRPARGQRPREVVNCYGAVFERCS